MIADVVPIILSYCDAHTLARASAVSREWRRLALRNELWENLCRQTFGVSAREMNPRPDPVKQLYILSHRHLKDICRMEMRSTFRSLQSLPTIPISTFR